MPPKVTYILVAEDLSAPQVAVQAVHAAQALSCEKGGLVGETSVVICAVNCELLESFYNLVKHNLNHKNIKYVSAIFFEPPQKRYTACAFVVDNTSESRQPFRRFRLVR